MSPYIGAFIFLNKTPSPDVANNAPFFDLIFFTAHSPYALDAPDLVINATKIPNKTKKIKISQRNGKVVGCSVLEQDIETNEEFEYLLNNYCCVFLLILEEVHIKD